MEAFSEYTFIKYFFRAYYVPGTVLVVEDIRENKTDKNPVLMGKTDNK